MPAIEAATAKPSATVVFPVPPFWPTSDIVNIIIDSVKNAATVRAKIAAPAHTGKAVTLYTIYTHNFNQINPDKPSIQHKKSRIKTTNFT
jgi:hypothetical protein